MSGMDLVGVGPYQALNLVVRGPFNRDSLPSEPDGTQSVLGEDVNLVADRPYQAVKLVLVEV
eukprot:3062463-Rhodomonas_salina.2